MQKVELAWGARGLSRTAAALYIGVSVSKFDELVSTGRMPPPKKVDGRRLFDRWELDRAFDDLGTENVVEKNPWD